MIKFPSERIEAHENYRHVGAGWKGPFRAGEKGPNSAERKGPNTPAFS